MAAETLSPTQVQSTSSDHFAWAKNSITKSFEALKNPNNVSVLNTLPFIGRGIEVVQSMRANYSTKTEDIMVNLREFNHKKALTCAIIRVASTIAISIFLGSSSIFFFALFDITTVINCYIFYNKFSEKAPTEAKHTDMPPPYQCGGEAVPTEG